MKTILPLALAAALSILPGAAWAADAPFEEIPGVVVDDVGYDLEGVYATIYGVYQFGDGGALDGSTGIGVTVGVNAISDAFIYGGALSLTHFVDGEIADENAIQAVGRAGVLITEGAALSALLGIGYETENDDYYIATGLSLEMAFSDNVSVRAQYQANYVDPIIGGPIWVHSLSGALVVGF